ncbi:hypothetical protein ACFWXA_13125 [Streptomyces atroolivaceus]|uniref:hypothetical protein n=1 Tax=Streptomyces atroolivaceus TaxID=66869 RepID=UPI00365A0E6C
MTRNRAELVVVCLHQVILGALAAAAVHGVWFLATGHSPSMTAAYLASQLVLVVGTVTFAVRERRQRDALTAAYEAPAFGEGFEPPHRPPTDDTDPRNS